MYITDRLNEHLPEHLHLSPGAAADEALQGARAKGWTPEALAQYITRKCGPTAGSGVVISLIRNAPPADQHKKPGGGSPGRLILEPHPFDQSPDNEPGWCRCQLPRGNRHHPEG